MHVKTIDKADKELKKLPLKIQKKFLNYFQDYSEGLPLSEKIYKKLKGSDFFEFRVKGESGIYRAIAAKVSPDLIVVLFFHKKSQKTPVKEIKTATSRISIFIKFLRQ